MRIVTVEDVFFPESGYQINILAKHMVTLGHEVIIITSEYEKVPFVLTSFFGSENISERDRHYEVETGVKVIRVPIHTYYSGRSIYKSGMFKLIDSLNPDILYVHGEDTFLGIRSLLRYRRFAYPVIFDDHMTYIASVNPLAPMFGWGYRTFIAPIIRRNDIIVIRTLNDDYVTRHLGIPEDLAPYIGFGSDLMTFFPDKNSRKECREELRVGIDDFVFVYAGKMDESKGGLLLAEAIKERIQGSRKRAVFLIVGTLSAINSEYSEKVGKILKTSENRLIMIPTQPFTSLAKYYQCADVALFPRQCSLSFFDVQACGLPVIFEDNSINAMRMGYNNAKVFKSGNVEDFRGKMLDMLNMTDSDLNDMRVASREYVVKNYDYSRITASYLEQIDKAIKQYWERVKR